MSPPSRMLFPFATQVARWGTLTVAVRHKIRSFQIGAVRADARLDDCKLPSTLSIRIKADPSHRTAVRRLRHSSSSCGAVIDAVCRPVPIRQITFASRPLPVPACGASMHAKGIRPEMAGLTDRRQQEPKCIGSARFIYIWELANCLIEKG